MIHFKEFYGNVHFVSLPWFILVCVISSGFLGRNIFPTHSFTSVPDHTIWWKLNVCFEHLRNKFELHLFLLSLLDLLLT
jgi:hypothetical protein